MRSLSAGGGHVVIGTGVPKTLTSRILGPSHTSGDQDARTVKLLRMGVGVVGAALPVALIAGDLILGDKVIVPSSMSSSYYTATRDLFVGALCALGGFLIGYRHTVRQNRCTWFAGVCALLVAFAPTAPSPPATENAAINWLHHLAAAGLIFTLGAFCFVVFTDYALPARKQAESIPDRFRAWLASVFALIRQGGLSRLYLICGCLVFLAGGLAVYTGFFPAGWSSSWQSLYAFEGVAVAAFGVAWMTAGVAGSGAG
jgi:hypothetical protein